MAGSVSTLYDAIVADLVTAGQHSPYPADANEPDPRYQSYGVRMPQVKQVIRTYKPAVRALTPPQKHTLANRLITSEVGEQQTVALAILQPLAAYFSADKLDELDALVRCLHGWSKIDAYTGSLLRDVLLNHPAAMLALVKKWNTDSDLWLRRASVVLFTRKIARTGTFNDTALALCHNLRHDSELLVQKGVGWSLKDMMHSDRPRIISYVRQLRREGVSSVITLYALKDIKGAERAEILA